MTYSAHRVPNGDGTSTLFVTRISDAAFAEWLNDRDGLREAGFPDRPPDVDGPTLRTWVPHPGEEDHPFFADYHDRASLLDAPTYPVYIAKWHSGPLTIRITLSGRDEGDYAMELLASGPEVPNLVWPAGSESLDAQTIRWQKIMSPTKTDEAVWASVERKVEMINERHVWGPDEPYVTTYFDILELEAEVELAEADAKRGFPYPLPDARA